MTRNKAYKILGIEEKASVEEIKAAYAELSKKYHPEENPEEFQQIHEAYTIFQTREVDRESHRIIIEYMRLWDEVLLQENEYLAAFRAFLDQKKEAYYTPEQLHKDRNTALIMLIILFVGLFAALFLVLR